MLDGRRLKLEHREEEKEDEEGEEAVTITLPHQCSDLKTPAL